MHNGKKLPTRPDYRNESLRLIIEEDRAPHYKDPEKILHDIEITEK